MFGCCGVEGLGGEGGEEAERGFDGGTEVERACWADGHALSWSLGRGK